MPRNGNVWQPMTPRNVNVWQPMTSSASCYVQVGDRDKPKHTGLFNTYTQKAIEQLPVITIPSHPWDSMGVILPDIPTLRTSPGPWSAMAQTWNVSNHDWKLMKQNSSLMPHKCPGEQRTHTERLKYFGLMFGSRAKNRDDSGMKRHHFHHISCLGGDPGLTGQILEVRYTRTSVETRNKYSLIISYYVLFNFILKDYPFQGVFWVFLPTLLTLFSPKVSKLHPSTGSHSVTFNCRFVESIQILLGRISIFF